MFYLRTITFYIPIYDNKPSNNTHTYNVIKPWRIEHHLSMVFEVIQEKIFFFSVDFGIC